jgi:hypothetical protein
VHSDLDRELPLPVSRAIYQLVLDASRVGPPTSVLRVAVEQTAAGVVRVAVAVEAPDGVTTRAAEPLDLPYAALLHAEDRFVALGGRLEHVVRQGVLEWEGTVPCG